MGQGERGVTGPGDADLEFLAATGAPEVGDRQRLKRLLAEDGDFREAFLEDERVFRRIILDKDAFLRISPRLYFEVLLRRTRREIAGVGHTIEQGGSRKIAVFDAGRVVDLLSHRAALLYLADMLASFTRVESYTLHYRAREGAWRKQVFSDMDIDSLERLCEAVSEEHRLAFYKRIADVCLFVLGMFPEHAGAAHGGPAPGSPRSHMAGRGRRSAEDFAEEGRRFYGMAAEHPAASSLEVSSIFRLFRDDFLAAKKPLNFIADRYLRSQRRAFFGS
jgi:hypothetical protein